MELLDEVGNTNISSYRYALPRLQRTCACAEKEIDVDPRLGKRSPKFLIYCKSR
jgi:hypothetical protein